MVRKKILCKGNLKVRVESVLFAIILGVFVFIFIFVTIVFASYSAKQQFEYAQTLEKKGEFHRAIQEYVKVYNYPEEIEWCYKAWERVQAILDKHLKDACEPNFVDNFTPTLTEYYNYIIQKSPNTEEAALALFGLGMISSNSYYQHIHRINFKNVSQIFQKIVDDYAWSKLFPHALMELANSYTSLGYSADDSLKAITIYQQVIKNYPNTLYAILSQFDIATVYFNRGEYKKAIEEYEKVLTNFPNLPYYGKDTYTFAIEEIKWVLSILTTASFSPVVLSKIKIQPDKWNIQWLKEHPGEGKINCYIGEIEKYSVEDIDTTWLKLNVTVPAENSNILGHHPGFAGKVLQVKFNKFDAIKSISNPQVGKEYEVFVYGSLKDKRLFFGTTTITIIGKK